MSISLKQLTHFIALAETGQVSRAALRCHLSQSSMTISLRKLEAAVGAALFDRHPRGLVLTEAGERFLRHAQHVVATMRTAVAEAVAVPDPHGATVRLGVTETITAYVLPALLGGITQRFPNLRVQVIEGHRAGIEADLRAQRIDLALVLVSNVAEGRTLQVEPLLASPRRLWLRPEHPLALRERITLQDIAAEPYILLDMDEHLATFDRYWQRAGLKPNILLRTTSIEAVRSLVAGGQGVTILSDLVFRQWSLEGTRLVRRDVDAAIPSMDVGIVSTRRAPGRGADLLRAYLRGALGMPAGG